MVRQTLRPWPARLTDALVMGNTNEYEKRAQQVADTLRAFLIAINTGGVGILLAVAGSLVDHRIHPKWAVCPVLIFIAGIVVVGVSLLLAKHREIKRSDAVRKDEKEPDFSGFFWRSYTWDALSLVLFVIASIFAFWKLSGINVDP